MRTAVYTGLLVITLPAMSSAQSAPYVGTIADPQVVVRAGPSDQFPETGTLPKDARVVVDHEDEKGWLAIQAPPGSVSWVATQFLDTSFDPAGLLPQNVTVSVEGEITLAAGKVGSAEPLDIRRVTIPKGTILVRIGPKTTAKGKTWYPVQPPWGDFRYVPKSAVVAGPAPNTSFVVRGADNSAPAQPTPGTIPATPPGPAPVPPTPAKPVVNDPLWAQAEAAEKEGRTDDAEKLYFQLAAQMNKPGGDHDIANLCYTRIHTLREKKRALTPTGTLTSNPARDDRPATPPPAKDTASSSRTTGVSGADRSPPGVDNPPRWAVPGMLVLSPLRLDGRTTYSVETDGTPKFYVVAVPGFDLEPFRNKRVNVYGSVYTRRDVYPKPYIVAAKAEVSE